MMKLAMADLQAEKAAPWVFVVAMIVTAAFYFANKSFHLGTAHRERPSEKEQLAVLGELETQRAVHDFKDSVLRGDPQYFTSFLKHLDAVEHAATLYGMENDLVPRERKDLAMLEMAVPAYRSAIYTVKSMRDQNAKIEDIDALVKGVDRPIGQAFDDLVASADTPADIPEVPLVRGLRRMLYGVAVCLLFYVGMAGTGWGRRLKERKRRMLLESSSRIALWEENEKAEVFVRLHEGVCQSLCGAMYLLGSNQRPVGNPANAFSDDTPASVIASLQAAITDTQAIAIAFRPSKIQECGLLEALQDLWLKCNALGARFQIQHRAALEEKDVPDLLKPVILRIAQMAVDMAMREERTKLVVWVLTHKKKDLLVSVRMSIDRTSMPRHERPAITAEDFPEPVRAIRDRVVLSGGRFENLGCGVADGILFTAIWPLDDDS